jgi:hypothetical protein
MYVKLAIKKILYFKKYTALYSLFNGIICGLALFIVALGIKSIHTYEKLHGSYIQNLAGISEKAYLVKSREEVDKIHYGIPSGFSVQKTYRFGVTKLGLAKNDTMSLDAQILPDEIFDSYKKLSTTDISIIPSIDLLKKGGFLDEDKIKKIGIEQYARTELAGKTITFTLGGKEYSVTITAISKLNTFLPEKYFIQHSTYNSYEYAFASEKERDRFYTENSFADVSVFQQYSTIAQTFSILSTYAAWVIIFVVIIGLLGISLQMYFLLARDPFYKSLYSGLGIRKYQVIILYGVYFLLLNLLTIFCALLVYFILYFTVGKELYATVYDIISQNQVIIDLSFSEFYRLFPF